jgi:membrane protease YdiL (CAAX protease family)
LKKYKIIWFCAFTIIFTVILGGITTELLDVSEAVMLAGVQLSPLFGFLLLCALSRDFSLLKEVNLRIDSPKLFKWFVPSVFIPVFIICGSALLMSAVGNPFVSNELASGLPLLAVIVASIIGCFGEQIGWRGFMLPTFQKKHSLLISSVFTGLFWGAWHFGKIPLFGVVGYLLFVLLIVELSILMSWIYDNTKKNLFFMVLFHLSINISSVLILSEREGILFYVIGCAISGILCLVVVLANWSRFLSKPKHE